MSVACRMKEMAQAPCPLVPPADRGRRVTGPQYDHDVPPPLEDDWPAPADPFPDGPGDRLPFPRFRRDAAGQDAKGYRGRGDSPRARDGRDGSGRGGEGFERVPPQDIAAEQSVLGG